MTPREALKAAAASRILLTDGAFGTEIQNYKLDEAAYAGSLGLSHDQKGNNDLLALTRPDVVDAITRAYLAAGADIVSTNTFSANRISQADYGAEDLVRQINLASARIARAAADEAAEDGRPRFVAGAIGPTNKTLSLSPDVNDPGYREIDFDYLKGIYREQIDALLEGGVDFILIETVFDTLNAKAGIMAGLEAQQDLGRDVPLMLSMTLTDLSGRNLSGHTVEAFWHAVRHARPVTIGLNCSFGAEQLRPHVRTLSQIADTLLHLGQVNAAERLAFDSLEFEGESPAVLRALVRIRVVKGFTNAARIFLNRLQAYPEHSVWALRFREALATNSPAAADPAISRIHANLVTRDRIASGLTTERLLRQALESNPENRMAAQYLMAHQLLMRQLLQARQTLATSAHARAGPLPRHYAEALLLHRRLYPGIAVGQLLERVPAEVDTRFRAFEEMMNRATRADEAVQAQAWREFGNTYWYYHVFGPRHSAGPLAAVGNR